MTFGLAQPREWPRRRWWMIVALVFAAQLAIIFWLGETAPTRARRLIPGPALRLAERGSSELMALTDPTLFALPHRQGFSGLAWLASPTQEFHPFIWSEPPRFLPLPDEDLAAVFQRFSTSNQSNPLLALGEPSLEFRAPQLAAVKDFPEQSTVRLTGELVGRRLLKSIALPSWQSVELLTNSRVQLVVDAEGNTHSAALLYPGSGSNEADSNALWQAISARFEPLSGHNLDAAPDPLSGLSWGQMVFDWHTLPMTSTNSPAAAKQ